MVEAAGGVVWRSTRTHHVEVLVVHRPHRRDWSLPKGKLERRETPLECALREVREETGLLCAPGPELSESRYRDRKGRPKRVRYWSMQERGGEFQPNAEVDEVRWTPVGRIAELLTYERDLVVVEGLSAVHGELVHADVA